MIEIILWILAISAFTLFGAWYARKFEKPDALIGIYVAFVVFSNIAAVKIAEFNLGFASFFAPAASLVFSVTFLLTDIVNEKFGRKETQKMILIAFLANAGVALFSYIALALPSAPFWQGQDSLAMILGIVPRILIASWAAFLISENFDAFIFAWFKKRTKGRHLWARNVFSSIPAMLLDSVIFCTLAFYGVVPDLLALIIGLTVIKWLVGIVNVPFMYLSRWIMFKK
ncbi:MAG: queuosine precursor transporter [Candidatus Diapherotrites archaeon]|nr:queuosine precursor transporter [Candidatus Diapherotrites archaeon]